MRYGTVIQFFAAKGFGFIKPDAGPDIYFHITAIGACQAEPEIKPGQAVKYELETKAETARREEKYSSQKPSGDKPRPRRAKMVELIDRIPGGTLSDGEEINDRHPRSRRKKPTWRR